ncbi:MULTISPECIES: hypothetical protein [unclassified Aurantimonas]|uniref:hypothetical protein n=1 Tax=unclassified Aurantimonas TaxID=2638230 RepID=UPI002E1847C8|nr:MULTISPECIES: hypothetical protein [unclassified Aurantimonas]MEC5291555.1 hypothetical protein [Aurantimonas sp. C2-3-R2]MEC5412639.1 hypothetical protein [Aurantimonas sp. C2-4-R8]
MAFFKEIEGEAAIVVENGVYRQVPLYERDGFLFAKVNGGFVKLMHDGSTTKAKMRLDFMTFDLPLHRDMLGRLCLGSVKGSILLEPAKAQKLIGSGTQ